MGTAHTRCYTVAALVPCHAKAKHLSLLSPVHPDCIVVEITGTELKPSKQEQEISGCSQELAGYSYTYPHLIYGT
jgi:hypothetical protein